MVKVRRPDDSGTNGEISPQEFERLLGETRSVENVQPGEIVSGTVVSVGKEWVFVDIGSKAEGMIALEEFSELDGNSGVEVGDEIEAAVLTLRGGIHLTRSLRRSHQDSGILQDAFENQIPVEGLVKEVRKGGFGIEFGDSKDRLAFCPISQIDLRFVETPEQFVGQTYSFRITEFGEGGGNIVVSRRALLEEEKEATARQTREKLAVGDVIDGTVERIMPYGAFVNIGGLDGLVHVSEIAWDRVEDPNEHLTEGQRVTVKVMKFDTVNDKLSLSIREAGADPWDHVGEHFSESQTVSGYVTRVEQYGAFVRIATGIEGLVHVSDMSWAGRVNHASDIVSAGDTVMVVVLNIDREKKRISLGMKQVQGDPFSSAIEQIGVGSAISGTVQRVGSGGVFVEITTGVVGFLPGSLSGVSRGESLGNAFKIGATVQLSVKEIDPERRRITLEAGDPESKIEQVEFKNYMKKQGVEETNQSLGTFGDLFNKAMKDKNSK